MSDGRGTKLKEAPEDRQAQPSPSPPPLPPAPPPPPNGATPPTQAPPTAADQEAPITEARIRKCLESADHWAKHLPAYAEHHQRLSDRFTICAAIFATITGLSVWALLAASPDWRAQLFVSAFAIIAATVGIVPKVKNYAEAAGKARELTTQYGAVAGDLLDSLEAINNKTSTDMALRRVVNDFELIKKSKDLLVPAPTPRHRSPKR